jgi:hypothetical protein
MLDRARRAADLLGDTAMRPANPSGDRLHRCLDGLMTLVNAAERPFV